MNKKSLVVYFSRTNLTKEIAYLVSNSIDSDIEKITTVKKNLNYLTCIYTALTKKIPKINKPNLNSNNYQNIIICSPIWAGLIANPVRSYLHNYIKKEKEISLVLTQKNSGGKIAVNELKKDFKIKNVLILNSKEIINKSYDNLRIRYFSKESIKNGRKHN